MIDAFDIMAFVYSRCFWRPRRLSSHLMQLLAEVTDGPEAAVRLWNLETKEERSLRSHTGHVHGLAFSPTAPLLATGGDDGTVRFWDLTSSNASPRTIGPGPFGGPVRSVELTPDGRYLATENANGMVYLFLWNTEQGNQNGRINSSAIMKWK